MSARAVQRGRGRSAGCPEGLAIFRPVSGSSPIPNAPIRISTMSASDVPSHIAPPPRFRPRFSRGFMTTPRRGQSSFSRVTVCRRSGTGLPGLSLIFDIGILSRRFRWFISGASILSPRGADPRAVVFFGMARYGILQLGLPDLPAARGQGPSAEPDATDGLRGQGGPHLPPGTRTPSSVLTACTQCTCARTVWTVAIATPSPVPPPSRAPRMAPRHASGTPRRRGRGYMSRPSPSHVTSFRTEAGFSRSTPKQPTSPVNLDCRCNLPSPPTARWFSPSLPRHRLLRPPGDPTAPRRFLSSLVVLPIY